MSHFTRLPFCDSLCRASSIAIEKIFNGTLSLPCCTYYWTLPSKYKLVISYLARSDKRRLRSFFQFVIKTSSWAHSWFKIAFIGYNYTGYFNLRTVGRSIIISSLTDWDSVYHLRITKDLLVLYHPSQPHYSDKSNY